MPAKSRELVEAPVGLASLARQLAASRAMVAALATGDELAFRRLTRPDVQHELDRIGGKPIPDWLRREVREARSNFAGSDQLRRSFAAIYPLVDRLERVLVDRVNLAAAGGSDNERLALVFCWCKATDCAGRWQIATFDADNRPDRPYLCARSSDYLLRPREGSAIQVDVRASVDGFAEPLWEHLRDSREALAIIRPIASDAMDGPSQLSLATGRERPFAGTSHRYRESSSSSW